MSRVDDEREAARLAERLAIQKQQEQKRREQAAATDSTFSRLVAKSQSEKEQGEKRGAVARSTIAKAFEEHQREKAAEIATDGLEEATVYAGLEMGREAEARTRGRTSQSAKDIERQTKGAAEVEREAEGKVHEETTELVHATGRAADEGASGGRRNDAREQRERLEEKKQQQPGGKRAFGAEKGDLKADADQQKGSGGKNKKDSKDDAAGTFRFNPVLMAPVPVAVQKQSSGSERLRALATEIAQKIVERVRVGKNNAGQAEFQIDLRSNVLSGLTIKVSGSRGKIRAVFSGNDREVLKLLREQSESLKKALESRGLQLEEFRVEER